MPVKPHQEQRETSTVRQNVFIGEAARALGLSVKALRLYERLGLFPPPLRTAAGYRVYTRSDLDRIQFVLWAKHVGLRLCDVKRVMSLLANDPSHDLSCAAPVLRARLEAVQQQLHALRTIATRLRRVLRSAGSSTTCLDAAAESQRRVRRPVGHLRASTTSIDPPHGFMSSHGSSR